MINSFKKKIKRFFDSRIKLLRDQNYENQKLAFSYNQISQLFSGDNFIPFSAWAISPSTILHVLNEIRLNKRKNIIEFGIGASTIYIAKLIKHIKSDAVFYGVESNEEWIAEMSEVLKLYGIKDQVKLIYAPLKKVPEEFTYKTQQKWYDHQVLKSEIPVEEKFDLVLVDGPAGNSSRYARFSAIPFLKARLSTEAIIFLDDVSRPDEGEILFEWNKTLNLAVEIHGRYATLKNPSNFDVSPFPLNKPAL